MPDQNLQEENFPEQEKDHETRDYAKLSRLNSDFAGWLWIPGTMVDLPVMNDPGDPQKYLRKDFFGKSSAGGSLFVAEGCGTESDCLLIYGHNMRNGTMFGSLKCYEKKSTGKLIAGFIFICRRICARMKPLPCFGQRFQSLKRFLNRKQRREQMQMRTQVVRGRISPIIAMREI